MQSVPLDNAKTYRRDTVVEEGGSMTLGIVDYCRRRLRGTVPRSKPADEVSDRTEPEIRKPDIPNPVTFRN